MVFINVKLMRSLYFIEPGAGPQSLIILGITMRIMIMNMMRIMIMIRGNALQKNNLRLGQFASDRCKNSHNYSEGHSPSIDGVSLCHNLNL